MISKRISTLLIVFFVLLLPLQATADNSKGGFSPDVAAFMETDGMTVFGDPEVMALQAKMAEYGEKEDLTAGDAEKATALIDDLFASIERIAREYMSGKRVAINPEHTVLNKKELPSCVDDGSCTSKKRIEHPAQVDEQEPPEEQQRSYQKPSEQPPAKEIQKPFGKLLNSKKPGSMEEVRASLKL